MTITNHFFGLIQCYSEQGVCYMGEYFEFNPGLLVLLYVAIGLVILSIIFTLWGRWRIKEEPAEPEQLLDSIVSQGEPQ